MDLTGKKKTWGNADKLKHQATTEIIDFLLAADEATARLFFEKASQRWRYLLEDIAVLNGAESPSAPQAPSSFLLEEIEEHIVDEPIETPLANHEERLWREKMSEDGARARKEPPIVQFSSAMYFCTETEDKMVIDVMRIGNHSVESKVQFTTKDVSAKAGVKYEYTAGVLVFGAGEAEKAINIPLRQSSIWETTTEFMVELLEEGLEGATLGRYLWQARVKVIDSQTFPSNKFRTEILAEKFEKIPRWGLFQDFCRWNFKEPVVRKGTIKVLVLDQLHSCFFLLKLLMNVYLIDFVLENKGVVLPQVFGLRSSHQKLVVIAVLSVAPLSVLHILDVVQLGWRVAGTSRSSLQRALLRKFLNYAQNSRERLDRAELVMGMTRDVVNVVQNGYMKVFALSKSVGQLVCIFLFQFLSVYLFDVRLDPFIFIVLAVFPISLIAFLILRRERTMSCIVMKEKRQDKLIAQVERVFSNYSLIADYNRRPFFVNRQAERIAEYNAASVAEGKTMKNNNYFSPWLTAIAVAVYTVFGGMRVLNSVLGIRGPQLSLGMFLANLTVIDRIGSSWAEIYKVLLEIQGTFPQLLNVVFLFNLETDVPERMKLNRSRRSVTKALRSEALQMAEDGDYGLPIDYLPIKMDFGPPPKLDKEVTVVEMDGPDNEVVESRLKCSGCLHVRQGTMVSIIGRRGEGKTTLLKIVGGAMLPGAIFPNGAISPNGEHALFVPSHLRVLHVTYEPLFFLGSLYENLTFGVRPGDPDGDKERVLKIMGDLHLSERCKNFLQSTGSKGDPEENPQAHPSWGDVLSFTEKCLCNITRALVANAEVLCIQKPTMAYDERQAESVLRLLRKYVDQKGIHQNEHTQHMRRPRTCIYTSSRHRGVKISDLVYRVSKEGGIEAWNKDEVTAEMLQ